MAPVQGGQECSSVKKGMQKDRQKSLRKGHVEMYIEGFSTF